MVTIQKSRTLNKYKRGQIPKCFGIGKKINGEWYFMAESAFMMDWSKNVACVWYEVPSGYYKPEDGYILINFNKKTSPVTLDRKKDRSNYYVTRK